MGPHVGVQFGGVAVGVCKGSSAAPQVRVERAALRAGAAGLAAGDEAGPGGPAVEVDGVGELGDLGALGGPAVGSERRLPRPVVEAAAVYGLCDLFVRARREQEHDIAVPASLSDARVAPCGVDAQTHLPRGRRLVAFAVARGDLVGELVYGGVEHLDVV